MAALIDPNDPALQPMSPPNLPLAGKKALVVGVANKDSIAYGPYLALGAWLVYARVLGLWPG